VVAEDIRNLQHGTGQCCRRLRRRRLFAALLGLLARPRAVIFVIADLPTCQRRRDLEQQGFD
jgi:hypothetical protein